MCQLDVRLPKYWQNLLFACFKIKFTKLSILFFKLLRLFCVNSRYSCQDTGKTLYSPPLKFDLRYYPIYFLNIVNYFLLIGPTFGKIWAKYSIHRLWNLVYVIIRSIFRTLEIIFHRLEVRLPRCKQNSLFAGFEIKFTVLSVLFSQH